MTAIGNLDDFAALDPFFRIIEEGLNGLADGDHFFDLLVDDVVFEYVITVPGYPRHVVGRSAVAELYRPYGDNLVVDRCFDLAVHHDRESGVVVLEYACEGRVVVTGVAYANRYIGSNNGTKMVPNLASRTREKGRSLTTASSTKKRSRTRTPFRFRPLKTASSRSHRTRRI